QFAWNNIALIGNIYGSDTTQLKFGSNGSIYGSAGINMTTPSGAYGINMYAPYIQIGGGTPNTHIMSLNASSIHLTLLSSTGNLSVNCLEGGSTLYIPNPYSFTENKTVALAEDLPSLYAAKSEIMYGDGDTLTNAFYYTLAGHITAGSKEVCVSLVTPKLLTNVSSVTVNKFSCVIRGVGGYINGNAYLDYANDSTCTVTATKITDNTLYCMIAKTTAFSGATNNTPLTVTFPADGLELEFH
ncbi:MAG: hypothetical protein J6S67_17350, partial [Methanobrevibacter sp.]|nr:hypothetical protein [Methanobrevibacter sp.]